MPIWKLQVEWAGDSILPRDVFCITPHFNDSGVTSDPDGLCEALATALAAKSGITTRQLRIRAYDAQGTPPVYPAGEAIRNVGSSPASTLPREVAVCLSFYSTRNIPTQRGRLFIPHELCKGSVSTGVRPASSQRAEVMAFGPIFANLGGPDVDWVVYSRKLDTAFPVTNYWVDDEWDTMRSRGLRATTRDLATTTEG